jgi:hypothetical protein
MIFLLLLYNFSTLNYDSVITGFVESSVKFIKSDKVPQQYKDQRLKLLEKQSLFIVGTMWNTQIHSVSSMQSFSVLKQLVYIVTTGI